MKTQPPEYPIDQIIELHNDKITLCNDKIALYERMLFNFNRVFI
jgi:hypothetical protein